MQVPAGRCVVSAVSAVVNSESAMSILSRRIVDEVKVVAKKWKRASLSPHISERKKLKLHAGPVTVVE